VAGGNIEEVRCRTRLDFLQKEFIGCKCLSRTGILLTTTKSWGKRWGEVENMGSTRQGKGESTMFGARMPSSSREAKTGGRVLLLIISLACPTNDESQNVIHESSKDAC